MTISITAERADSDDAVALIGELEEVLRPLYPNESRHGYSVDKLLREDVVFFVLREGRLAAGCGGVQFFTAMIGGAPYAELKRMYVRPAYRGRGYAKRILTHLKDVAQSRGVSVLRLETGVHQEEAIRLYEGYGFVQIGPFGPYRDDPLSLFYELRATGNAVGQD